LFDEENILVPLFLYIIPLIMDKDGGWILVKNNFELVCVFNNEVVAAKARQQALEAFL